MLNVNDGYKKLIIEKFREVPITMHIRDIEIAILDFISTCLSRHGKLINP